MPHRPQRTLKIPSALMILAGALISTSAWSATRHVGTRPSSASEGSYSENSSYGSSGLQFDLGLHYIRDLKPTGETDTATRATVGGMFNQWLGMDVSGQYGLRSKDFLVGAGFRFVPIEWFFLKAGVGGYSNKLTNKLATTLIGGAGIEARISRNYYFTTETSIFSVTNRDNISFGAGLGFYL